MAIKKVFTTGQAAKICMVNPRVVSKWVDKGILKAFRLPGSRDRRIMREDLITFMKLHGIPLGESGSDTEHLVRILTVGCNSTFKVTLLTYFKPDTFWIESTRSIIEAGMKLKEFNPTLMVVDLSLGSRDCLEMVTQLKLVLGYEQLKFLAINTEDKEPNELIENGFAGVIQLGDDYKEIAKKITELVF